MQKKMMMLTLDEGYSHAVPLQAGHVLSNPVQWKNGAEDEIRGRGAREIIERREGMAWKYLTIVNVILNTHYWSSSYSG